MQSVSDTPLNHIITEPVTERLLAALQDGEWHKLTELGPEMGCRSTVSSTLQSLQRRGYTIQVRRANHFNNAKEYRLAVTLECNIRNYDVVDVAILGRLYKYYRRQKRVQAGRIYLDISDKLQLEEVQTVSKKVIRLRNLKYGVSVKHRAKKSEKLKLDWKILPKGIKLLQDLAVQKDKG